MGSVSDLIAHAIAYTVMLAGTAVLFGIWAGLAWLVFRAVTGIA